MCDDAAPAATAASPGDDDARLVAACLRREPAAWRALVARYQRLVFAIVRRAGLDEAAAADVFQTVFVRLLAHLPRLAEPSRLQAWIVTTAKREALLQRRRGQRTVSMYDDDGNADIDPADDALLPEQLLDDLQQQARVRQAVARLDERCRALIELLFRDDDSRLPYDDVARRLGMPVGSLGPTRARCLDKLRRLVND